MPADPLLSLGRILGSFKLTLKPLSTLKNDIQSLSPPGSPGSSLWHANNMYSCQEKSSIIKIFYSIVVTLAFCVFYALQSQLINSHPTVHSCVNIYICIFYIEIQIFLLDYIDTLSIHLAGTT